MSEIRMGSIPPLDTGIQEKAGAAPRDRRQRPPRERAEEPAGEEEAVDGYFPSEPEQG